MGYNGKRVSRDELASISRKNDAIALNGSYETQGRLVDFQECYDKASRHKVIFSEKNDYKETPNKLPGNHKIKVMDVPAVQRAEEAAMMYKVGVLNFASAHHPGGGCVNGAMAQEESLCYSSVLHSLLVQCKEFYELNSKGPNGLYTGALSYIPGVPFIRDSNYKLLSRPCYIDVVTCAAVNANACEYPEDVENIMHLRMRKVLRAFAVNECSVIILGAWGCGVFGNSPEMIASLWRELLLGKEKWIECFREVDFAVYGDKRNYDVFRKTFSATK